MAFPRNSQNVLRRMHRKRKIRHFLQIRVRSFLIITTGFNLLDTKYEFYGFNNNLKDTIN